MGVNISGSGILSGLASLVMGAVNSLNLLVTRIIGYTTSSGGGSSYYTTMVGSTGPGYVLAKNDGIYYSTDLENLSTTKALDIWGISEILNVNGRFFTSGFQNPRTSSDGVNWSTINATQSALDSRFIPHGAFYIDNQYALVGMTYEGDGTLESPYIYRGMSLKSTDGVTWDWHLQPLRVLPYDTVQIDNKLVARFDDDGIIKLKYSYEGYYWYDLELRTYQGQDNVLYTGPIPGRLSKVGTGHILAYSNGSPLPGEYIGELTPGTEAMFFYEPSQDYMGLTSISRHENTDYCFAVSDYHPGKIFTANVSDIGNWVVTNLPSPLDAISLSNAKFINGLPVIYGHFGILIISRDPNTGLVTVDLSNINADTLGYLPSVEKVIYDNNKWISIQYGGISTGTSIFNLQYKNNTQGFYEITAGTISTLVETQVSIGDQGSGGAEILAPVDVYTVPSGKTAQINQITIKNNSANTITYDLSILNPGQELNDFTTAINDSPVLAGETVTSITANMTAGQRLVIFPSAVDVVEVKVYGTESNA